MPDASPDFESRDSSGSTVHFNGTVGISSVPFPASADKVISEFNITNPISNALDAVLSISLDGGVNFKSLGWNSSFSWSSKGGIKQIFIKASAASTAYEAIVNFEV